MTPQTLENLRSWLNECDRDHDDCGAPEVDAGTSVLPSRLISLDHSNDCIVRLIHTSDLDNSTLYCALSHCWGKKNTFTTRIDNIEAHGRGVKIEALPRTFQDTILICKELGIQYIWIDSLCIVQDSVSDWEVESAKMGSAYKNAHLTIAASRATGDTKGFLGARRTDTISPGNGLIRVFELDTVEPFVQDASSEINTASRRSEKFTPSANYGHRYLGWYQLIEKYSACQITKMTDRLPAVSGLAAEIASITHDRYYAGIWKNEVIRGLSWQVVKSSSRVQMSGYLAPSWSWSSLKGGVRFVVHSSAAFEICAVVRSVGVTPKGLNPFGEVVDGS